MKQHRMVVKRPWGWDSPGTGPPVQLYSSALIHLLQFGAGLLLSSKGKAIFCLQWKGKCVSGARGDLTNQDSIHPWSLIANKVSKSSLFGPKSTVLIGHNGAAPIDWWRCWWGCSCTVLIKQGMSPSYWLKYNSSCYFIRAGSEGRNII